MHKKIIVAIDGYSSCGKSTLAKDLAKELNIKYIDTGAMYRAVALYAMENKINKKELIETLKNLKIDFYKKEGMQVVYLNGVEVEDKIRSLEVANNVSDIAQIKEVRAYLVDLQRELAKDNSVVMDGRDIGTVVFPNANLKIFMTASSKVRAERRYQELKVKQPNISIEEVVENITKRDFIDENREESPLKKADDAFVLDNSELSREQQFSLVIDELRTRCLLE